MARRTVAVEFEGPGQTDELIVTVKGPSCAVQDAQILIAGILSKIKRERAGRPKGSVQPCGGCGQKKEGA